MPDRQDVINFAAGPSTLPTSVLETAAAGLLNYNNTGIGLAELSHRSPAFIQLTKNVVDAYRRLLSIPDTHEVLLMQGGGMGQFSAVLLNVLSAWRLANPTAQSATLDYVVTGSWSAKAASEAKRLTAGSIAKVNVAVDARAASADGKTFGAIPPTSEWKLTDDAAFVYYCDNETVNGVEFKPSFPYAALPANSKNLVADVSSNVLSRPIDVSRHALIVAGAQKNAGIAGLTLVIARKDLLVSTDDAFALGGIPVVPHMADYKRHADNESMYNTPPMFAIYVSGLVFEELERRGGVAEAERAAKEKSRIVYEAVEEGEREGVFEGKVQKDARSRMNVVWIIKGDGAEKRFLEGAETRGLKALKGHRSVGGIRASLYNGISVPQAETLAKYMREFIASERAARA